MAQDTAYMLTINLLCEGEEVKQMSRSFTDSLQMLSFKEGIVDSLQQEGYFYPEFEIDLEEGGEVQLSLELGDQTRWLALGKGNLEPWLLTNLIFHFIWLKAGLFGSRSGKS